VRFRLNAVDIGNLFGDKSGMKASISKRATKLAVVIVAAGRGERMGSSTPKQFMILCGKPVLCHSIDAFRTHKAVSKIVVVTAADQMTNTAGLIANGTRDIEIVRGGETRQESVRAGLAALAASDADLVAIHDAARPLLSHRVIDRLLAAMTGEVEAALPIMPVVDTLKSCEGGFVMSTLARDRIGAAQTPQVFPLSTIRKLHEKNAAQQGFTDDVSMVEAAGLRVAAVAGEPELMKLTQASDLALLTALLNRENTSPKSGNHMIENDIRFGTGFDVHKFSDQPGPIMLGGVSIPSTRGMLAHSDGDVALHALCDAIFGALGDGDIGFHFPPSDMRWKDADSADFLTFALQRCAAHGAELRHLDLTIICEQPKIGPHRDAIRSRISAITGLAAERIGVKATTSEGLGFTGRGEGIAAQAAATVIFKDVS